MYAWYFMPFNKLIQGVSKNMNCFIKLITIGSLIINIVGCASITNDSYQTVQVTTEDNSNHIIDDAHCVLKNKRGEWQLETQGAAEVHRSADNLLVKCSKEGQADGSGVLISRANGGMWGNILFGGGIGAIIDHNKGTAYNYPSWVKIIMDENLIYDKNDQDEEKILIGKGLTEEELKKIEKEKQKLEKAEIEKAKKEQAAK